MYQFKASYPSTTSVTRAGAVKKNFYGQKKYQGSTDTRPVIAVDFDGVLHDTTTTAPGRKLGTPQPGAQAGMIKLSGMGYKLVIWSLRGSHDKHVRDWLDYYQIPYDDITDIKISASLYIDDKALRHTDWHTTMRKVNAYL